MFKNKAQSIPPPINLEHLLCKNCSTVLGMSP